MCLVKFVTYTDVVPKAVDLFSILLHLSYFKLRWSNMEYKSVEIASLSKCLYDAGIEVPA
jgi:hypothetical protein